VKLYGLTGGPGMGKSEAVRFLTESGLRVVDTDDLARAVVAPGEVGFQAVVREFGTALVGDDGTLRRGALAEVVFKDAAARARLEAILHPLIRQRWVAEAENWRAKGEEAGVVVIPLLFETGTEQFFERVICIASSVERQSTRLQARGWSAEQVSGRLAAQWPIEKKMDRADYVVWNDSSVAVLREQLGRIPPLKGKS
jgi:dephospho-CoA kinase